MGNDAMLDVLRHGKPVKLMSSHLLSVNKGEFQEFLYNVGSRKSVVVSRSFPEIVCRYRQ